MTEGSNKKTYTKILSLDGGGIRGIITARILQEIENRTKKRIHELFDLIAGTSTGGILAAGLAGTPPRKNLPYTAKEMVDFYRTKGRRIFHPKNSSHVPPSGSGEEWSGATYSSKPLEEVLKKLLGDAKLKDTKLDIIATSYDIEARKPYLFKTSLARGKKQDHHNHLLRDVARATSAAPTYFTPLLLDDEQWEERRALIDGAVFALNPSIIALTEALSSGAKMEEILLCAVGTGMNNDEILYDDAKKWELWDWAKSLVDIVMDGTSDSAHHLARQLLPSSKSDDKQKPEQRYFRFDIELEHASDNLDDANKTNIENLLREADRIIAKQGTELGRLVKALTGPGTGGPGTGTGS